MSYTQGLEQSERDIFQRNRIEIVLKEFEQQSLKQKTCTIEKMDVFLLELMLMSDLFPLIVPYRLKGNYLLWWLAPFY